jgi:D-psicose/D-tagatose/L-ribulose 3-epimerase
MRISVSNIAWNSSEDGVVANLLARFDVNAIDVAPGKYFHNPKLATTDEIIRIRDWWLTRGIEIVGMQALLFGTNGLNLFGSEKVRRDMLTHLEVICSIGANLGAKNLVFGSPRNRDRTGLSDDVARAISIDFFGALGDMASQFGINVCLEPNPACYGSNFMTNTIDTARVVSAVAHPAIRMQLDTGAITINNEDLDLVINEYADLIGHIHASEPDLVTLGDGGVNHAAMGKSINKNMPEKIVSIEMLPSKHESNSCALERALRLAIDNYRSPTID